MFSQQQEIILNAHHPLPAPGSMVSARTTNSSSKTSSHRDRLPLKKLHRKSIKTQPLVHRRSQIDAILQKSSRILLQVETTPQKNDAKELEEKKKAGDSSPQQLTTKKIGNASLRPPMTQYRLKVHRNQIYSRNITESISLVAIGSKKNTHLVMVAAKAKAGVACDTRAP